MLQGWLRLQAVRLVPLGRALPEESGKGRRMTQRFFKEPEGGWRAWTLVLIGCYFFVETVFFRRYLADRLAYLIFGAAVLSFGVAELMPRERTRLAGLLRIGGITLMVLVLAVRALQLILFAA